MTVGQSPGGRCRCPSTETGRPQPGSKTGGCRDVAVTPTGCAVDVRNIKQIYELLEGCTQLEEIFEKIRVDS